MHRLNPEVLSVSAARAWGNTTPRPSRAQMVDRISNQSREGRVLTNYQAISVKIAREYMNEEKARGLRRVFEIVEAGI
jgi:hypothetical protein